MQSIRISLQKLHEGIIEFKIMLLEYSIYGEDFQIIDYWIRLHPVQVWEGEQQCD